MASRALAPFLYSCQYGEIYLEIFYYMWVHPRANGAERRAKVLIPPAIYPWGKESISNFNIIIMKSKVHQWSRAWVTVRGWSSSLISKYSGLSWI
jgi:hypothetical protein